ncbi:phytoene desaturase family protein [Methylomonas sp. SURF-2]|uniref:Phytoene desaturase family protein n=1 Tax=Methylomonas subterranea TaxID=2952225 RepID=A0ABT1TFK3_9GAMM|nr:phytoene desaturase family protein [Methylomonas sp. SURF-2]MCQ8104246.1 phytoene desaturase family protein [Methylomonas sp. SURF-2]
MPQSKHIIIVGAGPGGLCAGMLLSQRGFKVSIYDKNSEVGGRNRAIRMNGFTFDTGPTFLLMKGVLDEMFALCERRSEDYLQFLPLNPMYRLVYDDRELNVFSDRDNMRAELLRVFDEGADGYGRFIENERNRFNALYPCITRDYSSLASFFSWDLLKALPWLAFPKSVFNNLGQYFNQEKMRLAFCFQSKYLGMSPWDCPALFTMLPYLEHDYGIYHVAGGLNRIAQAMAAVILENGGEIHTDSPVQSLLIENGATKGVKLQTGATVRGDEVIVNADFAHAMTRLVAPGELRKYGHEAMEKREYSCSTFMLYLGLDKQYDLPHHTIVFAKDYTSNIRNIFRNKTLTEDFSFYVQNASVSDASLAPAGKSALYVLVPMPNNDSGLDWPAHCQNVREQVLDTLGARLGLSDIRAHIECEKIITPQNWETDEHVYKGATFSLSHKFSQMLYWRPHNRFEELDNCYLVGGGTHPGSGLPTIYESARISSNLISRKHRVAFKDIQHSTWLKKA